jgi:hypothetical protein
MSQLLILALPALIFLSLCALPRAAGTLYTIGLSFLLAQGVWWLGVSGKSDAGALAALLTFAQVAIVIAGLVQGLRLLALPADASRGRYVALVFGGVLIGVAVMRQTFGG